jgi:ribosomal protein S18 acetylase RimI-like enzyme
MPINALSVRALFDSERWWLERTVPEIQSTIDVGPAVGAWRDGQLIGFVRAVTDGRFRAYIEDCVVSQHCRRDGVATELLAVLMRDLANIDVVSLFCSPELVPVYKQSGFRATRQSVMHCPRRGWACGKATTLI